jgi:hypothetical protein
MDAMNTQAGPVPHPSASTPTPAAPRPAGRASGPWRWLVALVATALLVVSGSGLVAFAQSGAGASKGPIFLPAGTALYIEARLDMPAGQGEALAEFLTAFPGFADSASFDQRVDEMFDGLFSDATDGMLTYTQDIQPWITGELGLGLLNLAEAVAEERDPDILAGVAITDRAAADAFVTEALAESGGSVAEEPYGDTSILSDGETAVAVTDEFLLLGTGPDLVRTAIDVLAGEEASLADQQGFSDAFARVPAGHLAAAYVDFTSFRGLIEAAMAQGDPSMAGLMAEGMLDQLPLDMSLYLAAGPDSMTIEAFITPSAAMAAPSTGGSDLAQRFPAGTQVFVETRDLGSTVESALTQVMSMMEAEEAGSLAPIEDMLGAPLPSLLDFVGDAALGAALSDEQLWLGMAGEVTDETTANERIDRLVGLVRLAAASDDAEVAVTESDVDGVTVTTITFSAEATEGALPMDIGDSVSLAVADGALYLGIGDFVTQALAQDPATSLGAAPGYVGALGEDTANSGVVYVDVGAILVTLDPLLGLMMPEWSEVQPWVTGLDRFVAVGRAGEDVVSARMSLYVERG